LKNCRKQAERYYFDAKISASDVGTSHFENSFARSSLIIAWKI